MEQPKEFTGDGLYVHAKAGIYAIVNPIGEIYIGQSIDLEERVRMHKKQAGGKHPLLAKSMVRHGRNNHRYYLVMGMEEGVTQDVLKEWERFFIKKYSDDGHALLNCNKGGTGGKKGSIGSTFRRLTHRLDFDKFDQPL
jgi:group I intron endonuclease